MANYKPFINLGPGDAIREELEHYDWEQKDLAEIMGRSEKNISELVKNKTPITYDTALQLAKTFKQTPQFWLNLDAAYRQRMQETAKFKDTEARALIYRYMPVRELRKRINLPKKVDELVAAVKKFWRIEELEFGFLDEQVAACFRKSDAYRNFNPYFALTWLQLARNSLAKKSWQITYRRDDLAALAENLPRYTLQDGGVRQFIKDLTCCGVRFLHIGHFRQTYIDGASFFADGSPVVVYTARHDRIDNFWFTMAHELAHILLHEDNQGRVFIDSMDHLDLEDEREREADAFAERILKSTAILNAFKTMRRPSETRIRSVASELGLHPGIVAGCLQHHGQASWGSFHDLKPEVKTLLNDLA